MQVTNGTAGHAAAAGLLKLPSELLIAVFEHLASWEIAQLQRTCRTLHEIARSDEVWRPRVEQLVQLHVRNDKKDAAVLRSKPWKAAQDGVYARYVDGLLGNAACYLGWWASTQAYRGRLVRVSIQLDQFGDIAAICGEEASCSNAFEGELRNLDTCLLEKRWKPLAAIWHGHGEPSYRLPINHPSPDAGYSVDVLYPALSYSPVFRYTREEGFTLTASTVSTSTSTGQMDNTKISLPIRRSHRRKLNDVAGTTEQAPNRYSDEQGPSFPSRTAVRGNIVRPIALFGQNEGDSGQVHLQDEYLTASCFTIQATRTSDRKSQGRAASNGSSMDYIYQERDGVQPDQQPPGPVLLSNPGGNQLFRAFLEGIGAVLPPTVQDTVFGQNADDEDEQELFYPIKGPLHYQPASKPESQPYAALDLEGTWVGGYSTHGYEFGRIVVRNTWTRIHTADEVALEQIYDDESVDAGNADPSVAREPLMNSTIEGSLRRRRTIVEYIKITGDVNVPAGQVSWVAVLPSAEEERIPPSSPAANGFSQYTQQSNVEPDLDTMSLPTVKRSDWQAWSDLPPNSARLSDLGNSMPRWEEGTVRAAGRIAFTGFVDTRFIDAQATFVREENGEVDEIRVKWHEMAKVSTFRRIKLD